MTALPAIPAYLVARGARPGPDGDHGLREPGPGMARCAVRCSRRRRFESGLDRSSRGPTRADFLQGQLSNDVTTLAPGQGQWTTYNSPKGRMLATLFLIRDPDGGRYTALLARDLVESTAKRLSMFVLRAQVTVRSALDAQCLLGVGGPGAADAVERAFGDSPRGRSPGDARGHADRALAGRTFRRRSRPKLPPPGSSTRCRSTPRRRVRRSGRGSGCVPACR